MFLVPGDTRENEQDHVCVLNSVAPSIIERCRGKHPTAVLTWCSKPLRSVNNTARLSDRRLPRLLQPGAPALDMTYPAELYQSSPRPHRGLLEEVRR